jgi:hypothetical protein
MTEISGSCKILCNTPNFCSRARDGGGKNIPTNGLGPTYENQTGSWCQLPGSNKWCRFLKVAPLSSTIIKWEE